ncbi:hypothetical protein QQS21_002838 [Conoideocrella luteorostrata]|uniref:Nucleolar protein NOP52 variant n=1 Tax=Conoideocrella luteorostrata TaxID=1105319 RepID=A0AAJ0FW51_9HYPO|nr:hypothetical protein QQS21_002838 [Conoideocrella luteorostrata]
MSSRRIHDPTEHRHIQQIQHTPVPLHPHCTPDTPLHKLSKQPVDMAGTGTGTSTGAGAGAGAQTAQMPFIRNLASSDRKLRTQSLATLQSYLSTRPNLPLQDALKLWTGLYYALWMTDRPRPQQALASELAALLFELPKSSVAAFLQAFWQVLSKQWPGIDALRMDKFLLLVRRVFAAHVRYARERRWTGKEVRSILDILGRECFDVQDEQGVALGLRLHVLDLWVDEMEREKAVGDSVVDGAADVSRGQFVTAMGELVEQLRRSPVKSVRGRAQESYADERLPWGTKDEDDEDEPVNPGQDGDNDKDDDDDDDGWGGIED